MDFSKVESRINKIYPNAAIELEKGCKYNIKGEDKYFYYHGEQSKDEYINVYSEEGYLFSVFIDKYL